VYVPDVDFLGARFVADHLGSHPGDGAGKRHLRALLVPLATRAKVRDLDDVVPRDQHTGTGEMVGEGEGDERREDKMIGSEP
jgi:hypothetical protein